jgi:hypothetical protein
LDREGGREGGRKGGREGDKERFNGRRAHLSNSDVISVIEELVFNPITG